METYGNTALLDRRKVGFLAGSKIAALSVLPALDWAAKVARREDVAVVSGFHSPLERQLLDFLLRGRCGIVCVLARYLYKSIPTEFAAAHTAGRVLFLSEEHQGRVTKESALRRNSLVISLSDEIITPTLAPDSSLTPLLESCNKTITTL